MRQKQSREIKKERERQRQKSGKADRERNWSGSNETKEENQGVWVPHKANQPQELYIFSNLSLKKSDSKIFFCSLINPPSSPASHKKKKKKKTCFPSFHLLILLQKSFKFIPRQNNQHHQFLIKYINTPIGISDFFIVGSLSLPLFCSIFRDLGWVTCTKTLLVSDSVFFSSIGLAF